MRNIFIALVFSALIYSCSTDFEVIGEWKETPVVYGLLNPVDSIQYIRINKAYLGEGNALTMAQSHDSVYYGPELTAKLERWNNGSLQQTINLVRDSTIAKQSGVFNNAPNVLYRTTWPEAILQDGSEYKLIITNTATGHITTSMTPIVSKLVVDNPSTTPLQVINFTKLFTAKWYSSQYGRLYNLTIRFHYYEVNKVNSDTSYKYIDWVQQNQKSTSLDGGEKMEMAIGEETFYKYVGAHIPRDENYIRFAKNVEFIFTVGADDFTTYIEVSQPSTGIIQEKPFYTNVEGGIGIFSSRYSYRITKDLGPNAVFDSLSCGIYTRGLGFLMSDTSLTCP